MSGEPHGAGYRIIAYRNDGYVNVYDDDALLFEADEKFDVTEKGLNKHVQVTIENACLKKRNGCQQISFCFRDIEGRIVNFSMQEKSKRKTIPMNLLAPVGYGSKTPNFLPLFFMYDFDFMRRGKTCVDCKIADWKINIDTFPMPMNLQFRYFIRYSNQCDIIEFANADETEMFESEFEGNSYKSQNAEYIFDAVNSLSEIILTLESRKINIKFSPSFNMNKDTQGTFAVYPEEYMGYVSGIY